MIFAHGSRFGGHTLFIKDRKLHYVYNFLGIKPEQKFVSQELQPGKHDAGRGVRPRERRRVRRVARHREAVCRRTGRGRRARCARRSGKFTLCGDGLCVGFDSADHVSRSYPTAFPFTGGRILGVAVDVSEEQYLDLEREASAAFARD